MTVLAVAERTAGTSDPRTLDVYGRSVVRDAFGVDVRGTGDGVRLWSLLLAGCERSGPGFTGAVADVLRANGPRLRAVVHDPGARTALAGSPPSEEAHLALLVTAAAEGVDLADPRALSVLGLDDTRTADFALRLWGWTVLGSTLRDGTLTLVADVEERTPLFTALATAVPHHTPGAERVVVRLNGEHRLSGPVEPWAQFRSPDADRVLVLVELLGTWAFDDRPALSRDVGRRLLAGWVEEAGTRDPRAAVARLRRLREAAVRLGDDEVAAAVRSRIASLRDPASISLEDIVKLRGWRTAPMPGPEALGDDLRALKAARG
ncbi:hypothetical protein [Saccharothrix sp. Mg75]|uniref:hypothetical protein n=1 Tax=Saccharothrix sp. Mg75 TaxID=3445357 RepID=UPI003EF030C7